MSDYMIETHKMKHGCEQYNQMLSSTVVPKCFTKIVKRTPVILSTQELETISEGRPELDTQANYAKSLRSRLNDKQANEALNSKGSATPEKWREAYQNFLEARRNPKAKETTSITFQALSSLLDEKSL